MFYLALLMIKPARAVVGITRLCPGVSLTTFNALLLSVIRTRTNMVNIWEQMREMISLS